jgi:probable HAF family extracellular repeat protein
MNNNGTLVGWADTPARDSFPAFCFNPDCCVSHALQWHDGAPTDLGSLAEAWSSAASWINNRGEVVGVSQNRAIDPAIGFPEERAVFWRDGQMTDLGTLGGNQSLAGAINNHGGEPSSFRPANSTRNLRTHAACCTVVANGEQSVPLTRA